RMSYALKIVLRSATRRGSLQGGREALSGRIEVVNTVGGPTPHAEQVADHAQGVDADAHTRCARVRQLDGNLREREPIALREMEQLDIEREAVDVRVREQHVGGVGPKRLQPTLGVAVLAEQHRLRQRVE